MIRISAEIFLALTYAAWKCLNFKQKFLSLFYLLHYES